MSNGESLAVKVMAGTIIFAGVLVFGAGMGLLLAFPIKWTWNATMPYIFGLPVITWGKAWCLNFLAANLIKSSLISTNK